MLMIDALMKIKATPKSSSKPKKNKVAVIRRLSPKQKGDLVAKNVIAAIKKFGPVCVSKMANITGHSQAGIRSCITRINEDDSLFVSEPRKNGPSRKDVLYYSLTEK